MRRQRAKQRVPYYISGKHIIAVGVAIHLVCSKNLTIGSMIKRNHKRQAAAIKCFSY